MRGGSRHKLPLTKGTQALIDAIWKSLGGASYVARKLNVSRQTIINWRNRGRVPILECHTIAKTLGISEWGLNYVNLKRFYGTNSKPSWYTVVNSYGLTTLQIRHILSLEEPCG